MGLSARESGLGAARATDPLRLNCAEGEITVALAGNPNVGKSTLFNALTGLNQHTGNWAGKTVACAAGRVQTAGGKYFLVDIPGTYSLYAHSKEEEVASDFITFGGADVTVVVCDATCIERSLGLVLGIMEVSGRVLVAVNLMDEAERKGIRIDLEGLSALLGTEVVGVVAKKKKTLSALLAALDRVSKREPDYRVPVSLGVAEDAVHALTRTIQDVCEVGEPSKKACARYAATRMLCGRKLGDAGTDYLGYTPERVEKIAEEKERICKELLSFGMDCESVSDLVAERILEESERIAAQVQTRVSCGASDRDRRIDRILTGRLSGYPIMLLLLFGILYITVSFANYPSELLSRGFDHLGMHLHSLFDRIYAPDWLRGALLDGVYTVLTEVIAVMLPPMAIFFPLFTLLEDSGYLPRVAYNLDAPFRCVGACGKQSLTMCMGLGCNAAGIVGCRIIDSPRERALATVTNSLVPCNGKFPTIILIVGTFFSAWAGAMSGAVSALLLLLVVVVGVLATFLVTFVLSRTVYRGTPSFFTLEMPPFRRPSVLRVLARSFLDRTVYVLGRAAAVAAPAGLALWLLVTVKAGDASLFVHFTRFLDPLGRFMGMDGIILAAFILGTPANEIVLPIAIVGYASVGIGEALGTSGVGELLISGGWTPVTAVCVILFSLMHWPCSTAIITAYKETKSIRTTLLAALAPTALGFVLCVLVKLVFGGLV